MKQKNQTPLSLPLLIALLCILSGCYEPVEGCLDPLSANFNLTADNDCEDCCSYPAINIRFYPMWDTLNLSTTVFYTNQSGDSLQITEASFLVSNAYLTGESVPELSSQDSVVLDCDGPLTMYNALNNITINSQTAQIANVLLDQGYTNLHMTIGIASCLATVDTSAISSLSTKTALFENELSTNTYQTHQFSFAWTPDNASIQDIQLVNDEGLTTLIFNTELLIERGSNLMIEIDVDYSEWFTSFEINDSEETLKRKLIQNAAGSFSLRE